MYGMQELMEAEGFDDEMAFLEEFALDSVVPGICKECGYTASYEPDQDKGWCEDCNKGTVVSALILSDIM